MKVVRAPGKAMLIGEYAVLDGGPGAVAAVDAYAEAWLVAEAVPTSPFIAAAKREVESALQLRGYAANFAQTPVVDTTAFSRQGRKLGLGSSAAATVAAVGALFYQAGLPLGDADVQKDSEARRLVHEVARRAHDDAQGVAGSGADVLASTWGGLRALNDGDWQTPLRLPSPLTLRFVATAQSAATAPLIARYRAVGAAANSARQRMALAAERFLAACRTTSANAALAAMAEALAAFLALEAALGCELVTPEHRAICAAAQQVGGVAKPSGAGGGDLAVVLLPDGAAAETFAQRLAEASATEAEAKLWLLPLEVSAQGVHILEKP